MKLIRRLTLAVAFLIPVVAIAATESGKPACCGMPCCASGCPFCH